MDGLGYGGNTKAAIIRIGLLEMSAFTKEFFPSSSPHTFSHHSAGVADLITVRPLSLLCVRYMGLTDDPRPRRRRSVAATASAPKPSSRAARPSTSLRRSFSTDSASRALSPPVRRQRSSFLFPPARTLGRPTSTAQTASRSHSQQLTPFYLVLAHLQRRSMASSRPATASTATRCSRRSTSASRFLRPTWQMGTLALATAPFGRRVCSYACLLYTSPSPRDS